MKHQLSHYLSLFWCFRKSPTNEQRRNLARACYRSLSRVWLGCDHKDCSPPGSSVHGILQARILEWVAVSFSRGSSWPTDKPVPPAWQTDSLPLSHLGSSRHHLVEKHSRIRIRLNYFCLTKEFFHVEKDYGIGISFEMQKQCFNQLPKNSHQI